MTKRKRKKKSHRRGGPSISGQTLGMTSPINNAELAAAAARTPSPITSTYLSSPNSSLMGMTPRRSITPQSSPSPLSIQIKKFHLCVVILNILSYKRLDNLDLKQRCDRNMGFLIINLLYSLPVDQI